MHVTLPVRWTHDMTECPVDSVLSWDTKQPLEVKVVFECADGDVTWVFARDLLSDAFAGGCAGDGDVHLCFNSTYSRVTLSLIMPSAKFHTAAHPLKSFMLSVYSIVGRGEENVLVDELIANLLG